MKICIIGSGNIGGALAGKGIRGHGARVNPMEGILHPTFMAGLLGIALPTALMVLTVCLLLTAVVAKGGAGRFGTWAFSYGYTLTAGLGEFAKMVVEGKAKKDSLKDVFTALGKFTPGAKWNGAYYLDVGTGVRAKNHILVFMDTYVLGKGFLPTT